MSVDGGQSPLPEETARAILRLVFDATRRKRMNELAAKNRAGRLTDAEEEELDNFIRAGQLLGILKSRARKTLRKRGS